jgi:predicted Na+-dependent transporter
VLDSLNKQLQKLIPILTPLSVVIGILLQDIGGKLFFLVPWLFAFMTFAGSLSMKFKDVKVFSRYPTGILFGIAFLHIIMPFWAYFLSTIIFHNHLLTIGFVISVAIPTGVTSLIWINMCKGNFPLGLSIILIDTLLAPFILPALLNIFVGETIAINTASIVFDLLWMIVLPSVIGILVNECKKGNIQEFSKKLAPFSKLSLFAVVIINSSAVAPYLTEITWELVAIILVVFFLAGSAYAIALVICHLLFKDTRIVTTLVFISGMRNIPIGIIIAISYFPTKVAMPVVFCMLFQQILAALFAKVLEKYQMKYR